MTAIDLVILCCVLTGVLIFVLFRFVDLTPQVGENFFFSSDDPQLKEDRLISEAFPQPSQLIIGARGDIFSSEYVESVHNLSEDLLAMEEVFIVQSISHGPSSVVDAINSPLWKRMLIAEDREATFLSVFFIDRPAEEYIPTVEAIAAKYERPGFELMVSGAPYIMELIRRNLLRDLKMFSVAAFALFGLVLLLIFRSFRILMGTLIACVNASCLTLIFSKVLHIEIGPLTANLSTIVFVLTLTHIVFLTFNWRETTKKEPSDDTNATVSAIRLTFEASFWSMLTTLLGFSSLLFVQATPLKHFGISGSLGTLIAFIVAYTIYPWFLVLEERKLTGVKSNKMFGINFFRLIMKSQNGVVLLLLALMIYLGTGITKVNTDPSLFSYFKPGGELRQGLEYIDKNGGSSPLKIVIEGNGHSLLDSEENRNVLPLLHKVLEMHPSVGSVVSLPLILAEARRQPFVNYLSNRLIVKILESHMFGEIAQYFITKDRSQTLFILRMNEEGRTESRLKIVSEIKEIISQEGLKSSLVGGPYLLQGKLSKLLTSSIISGITLLLALFLFMGFFISRSVKVTAALLMSLTFIPICMLGAVGLLRLPLDIISAPAANLAIAMGVDAMIHMLIFVKSKYPKKMNSLRGWEEAVIHLWRPVLASMIIVVAGFSIFTLSNFPPTQRFGISVVLGALLAPLATLFILPRCSTLLSPATNHSKDSK